MKRTKSISIPKDHPVQPLKPGDKAMDRVTCGVCGLSWDDAIVTSWTPAPSGRCPFEPFHPENAGCDKCGMNDRAEGSNLCPECKAESQSVPVATWANAEAGDTIGKPKTQHTPGPWQVHIFRYPNGQLNGTPSVYAPNGNDGGRHVCQVYDNGQLEANARLIAAAPDLLGSLKALFEHCAMVHSVWGDGCNQKQADAAIKAGRDAIAKAEGK